jgi:hypothetical protein
MLSGIRVLIVEDEALVAATLSDAVENVGGEIVSVARTVSETRELIRRLTFDVAVLDLHLPTAAPRGFWKRSTPDTLPPWSTAGTNCRRRSEHDTLSWWRSGSRPSRAGSWPRVMSCLDGAPDDLRDGPAKHSFRPRRDIAEGHVRPDGGNDIGAICSQQAQLRLRRYAVSF